MGNAVCGAGFPTVCSLVNAVCGAGEAVTGAGEAVRGTDNPLTLSPTRSVGERLPVRPSFPRPACGAGEG